LCSVLRLHQHSIGYTGDVFYRSKDPTNSIKVLKEKYYRSDIDTTDSMTATKEGGSVSPGSTHRVTVIPHNHARVI